MEHPREGRSSRRNRRSEDRECGKKVQEPPAERGVALSKRRRRVTVFPLRGGGGKNLTITVRDAAYF